MIGKKFNRLTVVEKSDKNLNGKRYWICECVCGNKAVTYTSALTSGNTKSCGCLVKETSRELIVSAREGLGYDKHGHSKGKKTSPTYQSWRAMKQRCNCPKNKDWHSYGGRGISYSKHWDKFSNFIADMGERPSKEYSLDRINPDEHYTPSNCQWILKSENSSKGNTQRKREAKGSREEVLG